jgi:hypothetical protein
MIRIHGDDEEGEQDIKRVQEWQGYAHIKEEIISNSEF